MLNKIINDEYERVSGITPSNEILESNGRLGDLITEIMSVDKELANNLDEGIGLNISLYSGYFFEKGFKSALKLINEIREI